MQSTSNSRCRYPLVTIAATRTVKESARTHSFSLFDFVALTVVQVCTFQYTRTHTLTQPDAHLDLTWVHAQPLYDQMDFRPIIVSRASLFKSAEATVPARKPCVTQTKPIRARCDVGWGGAAVCLIQRHILGRPHKFKMYSCPAHAHTHTPTVVHCYRIRADTRDPAPQLADTDNTRTTS